VDKDQRLAVATKVSSVVGLRSLKLQARRPRSVFGWVTTREDPVDVNLDPNIIADLNMWRYECNKILRPIVSTNDK